MTVFANTLGSINFAEEPVLMIATIAYLAAALVTLILLTIWFVPKVAGTVYERETKLQVIWISALFWPVWLLVLLMARGHWNTPAMPQAAVPAIKRKIAKASGFPVTVRTSEPIRCSECCRPLDAGQPRVVFRGQPVCCKCHEALAILDS